MLRPVFGADTGIRAKTGWPVNPPALAANGRCPSLPKRVATRLAASLRHWLQHRGRLVSPSKTPRRGRSVPRGWIGGKRCVFGPGAASARTQRFVKNAANTLDGSPSPSWTPAGSIGTRWRTRRVQGGGRVRKACTLRGCACQPLGCQPCNPRSPRAKRSAGDWCVSG